MDLFVTTFQSVAVLLGIGLIGFLIIQRKLIPGRILSLLSPLALDIALPSLIFVDILSDFSPKTNPDWWQLPLWWAFFTITAAGLMFLFRYLSKKETRKEFAITLFYQNGIFFPLAILSGMFGDNSQYIISLFLFTIFYPAFFFTTYQFFYPTQKGKTQIDWSKIFHPVLVVTIIAIILVYLGLRNYVPDTVVSIFSMIGAMTIPLLMIILGGNIYIDYKKQGNLEIFELIKFVSVKNFVFPLIFIGIVVLLKPYISYTVALLLVLQAAVPPVTAVPLVVERAGGNRGIVSQFMVVSFIVSLISIPLMVFLFGINF